MSDARIHDKLENIVESLDQCNSIIDVRFPIRRENGKLEIVRGFRVHYGEGVHNAPCLGGKILVCFFRKLNVFFSNRITNTS